MADTSTTSSTDTTTTPAAGTATVDTTTPAPTTGPTTVTPAASTTTTATTASVATPTNVTPNTTTATSNTTVPPVAATTPADTSATVIGAVDPLKIRAADMRNMTPAEFKPIEAAQAAAALKANPIPGNQDAAGVFVFLTDGTLYDKEKLAKVSTYGAVEFSSLVAKLVSYEAAMGKDAINRTSKLSAGSNFDLFSVLLGVISDTDVKSFTVKFMIVNMVFNMYAADAYSSVMLHRFDTDWTFGDARLKTFQILATIIPELCNPVTRQAMLSKVNLTYAMTKSGTNFSDTSIKSITNFYTKPLPNFPASTTSTYVAPTTNTTTTK